MKKVLRIMFVIILSYSLVGCNNTKKQSTTSMNLTLEEKELLTGDKTDYEFADVLQGKLEKDGFVYSYNSKEQVATVTSKDKKSTFTIVHNAGNYDVTFTDDKGEYVEGSNPTAENYDTCKHLIEILNTYEINFATLDWSFAGYAIDQKKSAGNSAIAATAAVTKMQQIGYTLDDKGGLSINTTDTNEKNVTYTFNSYGEFQVSDGGELPLLYKWKTNVGSMKYLSYDYNTDTITDVMGAFDNTAKLEFKINMMYLKQEFDKELSRAGITVEDLNNYCTVASEI